MNNNNENRMQASRILLIGLECNIFLRRKEKDATLCNKSMVNKCKTFLIAHRARKKIKKRKQSCRKVEKKESDV